MKTNMGCRTSWIVAVAISEITIWHRHFYKFYAAKEFIHLVDWKGEDEEGELANFAADRFYELTKNLTDSEELRNLLVEITQEDEISDVCEAGDRYLDEIFERIQTELNKRGFQIFDLNEGSDTYNVVVLPMSEYKKIEDFNTPWLEVQDFLS